ncbi:MAG: epoxyqueuosine reductase [Thermodesulfovibrionales bacterium]
MPAADDLKAFARTCGADLVGIADLALFREERFCIPGDLLEPYAYAVSVACRLDDPILDRIADHPTPEYADHYRAVNAGLDRITAGLVGWISGQGFRGHAVPASFITDEKILMGNVSHKAIARMAGIGWQGKSLLIVTPEHGPRIRLATVLTDMPLVPDGPIKSRCGKCMECSRACPAEAIKGVLPKGERYSERDEALFFAKCAEKTLEFKAMAGIGARICGVCVKACPHGRKNASRSKV